MEFQMSKNFSLAGFVGALFMFTGSMALGGAPGDLSPRVPPDQLEEAKSWQNPFPPSNERIAIGKKIYEGKAYCWACHGLEVVEGAIGGRVTPSGAKPPTNFADAAWQAARTDGEIFWILKHGSHGTDMAPYMPLYVSEEDAWAIVTYLRSFGGT
ncbi:MAG: c-type cytochrome [Nitrospirales bacterium]